MGLFLGDSEPSKIFVGDTQISKVFLGDTQVRPPNVVKTFTLAQQTSTSSTNSSVETSIALSGYKIIKVVIETSGQSRGSSYWGNMNSYVCGNAWSVSSRPFFRFGIGYGANNYSRGEYNNGSSTTNSFNMSGYSRTGNNVCTFVIERDGASSTINGTTTNHTYTTAEANVALSILDSTTPYAMIQTTQGTNGPATITVTYEPI